MTPTPQPQSRAPVERTEIDLGDPGAPGEPVVTIETSAARAVTDLLEVLTAMPSTPQVLADVGAVVTGSVSRSLPMGTGVNAPQPGVVEIAATNLAGAAGLLQRFGDLTSTPPVVAEDARSWAATLWERLEQDEVPHGHRAS